MSILIPIAIITEEQEESIIRDVRVKKVENTYNPMSGFKIKETYINAFKQQSELGSYYVPFNWALTNLENAKRRDRSAFEILSVPYNAILRSIQLEIKDEAIQRLNQFGCLLLSLYPGAGKTNFAIFLATKIKLKPLIVCHRVVLMEQWRESIIRFTGKSTKIAIIKPGKKYDKNADFFIVNAQNMKKLGCDSFSEIGFVIIDEIHAIMAESLSECMFYVSPRYLLGLSATPTRPDGMDGLLDLYFGKGNCIKR